MNREEDRIISATVRPEDRDTDTSLRPKLLRDYVGQEAVRASLKMYIAAAKSHHKTPISR